MWISSLSYATTFAYSFILGVDAVNLKPLAAYVGTWLYGTFAFSETASRLDSFRELYVSFEDDEWSTLESPGKQGPLLRRLESRDDEYMVIVMRV